MYFTRLTPTSFPLRDEKFRFALFIPVYEVWWKPLHIICYFVCADFCFKRLEGHCWTMNVSSDNGVLMKEEKDNLSSKKPRKADNGMYIDFVCVHVPQNCLCLNGYREPSLPTDLRIYMNPSSSSLPKTSSTSKATNSKTPNRIRRK